MSLEKQSINWIIISSNCERNIKSYRSSKISFPMTNFNWALRNKTSLKAEKSSSKQQETACQFILEKRRKWQTKPIVLCRNLLTSEGDTKYYPKSTKNWEKGWRTWSQSTDALETKKKKCARTAEKNISKLKTLIEVAGHTNRSGADISIGVVAKALKTLWDVSSANT